MQVDPRVLKQMIQMQITNNIDLTGTALASSTVKSSNENSFHSVLSQLMSTGDDTSSALTDLDSSAVPLSRPYNANLFSQDVSATPSNAVYNGATKPTAYDDLIQEASRKYGIDELLIKAVIQVESSYNPNTVSSAGAKGLMQLMDGTARGLGVSNSFDPAQNIDGGTRYLSYQLKRFQGQEKLALAAYNGGPNRLERLGIHTEQDLMNKFHELPLETQKYIGKIEKAKREFTH